MTGSGNCSICMTGVETGDESTSCPACQAPYHLECWTENGGCAVYGCSQVPATEGLKPLEIPPAFWGREDKNCPICNRIIAARAIRCRHCGAAVAARPEERTAYEARRERRERTPQLRGAAVAFVILSLVPVVAAFTAVLAWLFYRARKDEIRKVPGSCDGLYRIAIGVSTAQTAIIAIALLAFMAREALR